MGSISLWQAELSASAEGDVSYVTNGPLEGRRETDVAVVGGGITGTAVALWLARAGVQVRVLEARSVAAGASGRNGGFISDGTTAAYATTIQRYGREQARRLWVFTVRNHEYARRFLEELEQRGWPCAYRRNGSLKLAAKESELETIIESASLLNEDGWEVRVVQRNELPVRLRNAYFGGAFYPANGELPLLVTKSLCNASKGV